MTKANRMSWLCTPCKVLNDSPKNRQGTPRRLQPPQDARKSSSSAVSEGRNHRKPNSVAAHPSQRRQRGSKRHPKTSSQAPRDVPTRFKSTAERCLGSGQPGNLDFLRMYYTELQVLEVPNNSHNPPKPMKNALRALSGKPRRR